MVRRKVKASGRRNPGHTIYPYLLRGLAFTRYGAPDIVNTDQGSQFTATVLVDTK